MMRRVLSSAVAAVGTRSVARATPAAAAAVQPSAWCAGAVTSVSVLCVHWSRGLACVRVVACTQYMLAPCVKRHGFVSCVASWCRAQAACGAPLVPNRAADALCAGCVASSLCQVPTRGVSTCTARHSAQLSSVSPRAARSASVRRSSTRPASCVGLDSLLLLLACCCRVCMWHVALPRSTESTIPTQTSSTLTSTRRTTSACGRFCPSTPPTTSRVASCRCSTLLSARYAAVRAAAAARDAASSWAYYHRRVVPPPRRA